MSVPGDDDVGDRLDDIERVISEIAEILRAMTTGPAAEEVEEETGSNVDLWHEGSVSVAVDNRTDYIVERVKAANTETNLKPSRTDLETRDERSSEFAGMFMENIENLNSLRAALSDKDFKETIWKVALFDATRDFVPPAMGSDIGEEFEEKQEIGIIDTPDGDEVVVAGEDMLRLFNKARPEPEWFGVRSVSNDRAEFNRGISPLNMAKMYNTWWYVPSSPRQAPGDIETPNDQQTPWSALGLREPGQEDIEIHVRGFLSGLMIQEMAEIVEGRGYVELEEPFTEFL